MQFYIRLSKVIVLFFKISQALASCSYFQPFLQKVLEECELSLVEDQADSVPLTISLAALLQG